MARDRTLQRSVFFFSSLATTALQTLLPQRFLAAHAPDDKALWLPIGLVATSLCSLAGVWAGHVALQRGLVIGPALRRGLLVVAAGLFVLLHTTASPLLFAAGLLLLPALAQFLLNLTDNVLSTEAQSRGDLPRHAQQATLFQFFGLLLAPVCFGVLHDTLWPLVVVAVGALAPSLAGPLPPTLRPAAAARPAPTRLPLEDKLFLAFCFCFHLATNLLLATFYFLLQDRFPAHSSPQWVGAFLGSSNFVAIGSLILARRWLPTARAGWGAATLAGSSLVALAALGNIWAPLSQSLPYMFSVALPLGAANGWYLLRTRHYASQRRAAAAQGDPEGEAFLSLFNSVGNVSALTGFGVGLLLAVLAGHTRYSAVELQLLACITSQAIALGCCLLTATSLRRAA